MFYLRIFNFKAQLGTMDIQNLWYLICYQSNPLFHTVIYCNINICLCQRTRSWCMTPPSRNKIINYSSKGRNIRTLLSCLFHMYGHGTYLIIIMSKHERNSIEMVCMLQINHSVIRLQTLYKRFFITNTDID